MSDTLWEADLVETKPETVHVDMPPVLAAPDPVRISEPASGYPRLSFKVPGKPEPQGSKSGFSHKGTNVVRMVEANKSLKAHRQTIADYAMVQMMGKPLLEGPLRLSTLFVFERPKSHFTSKHQLTKSAPFVPGHQDGDLDKLVRAVCDGLTGVVFKDDSQVSTFMPPFGKRYGLAAATYIVIEPDPLDY